MLPILMLCVALQAGAAKPTQPPAELPVSVERVKRQLEIDNPTIQLDLIRPVFRLVIVEKKPRWWKDEDLFYPDPVLVGPTTPWHQDYLSMVTPPEFQSYGSMYGTDLLQVAVTSLASAFLVKGVVSGVKAAKSAHRRRLEAEAKQEVDDAVAAMERARAEALRERLGQSLGEPIPPPY
jgi:hypothetical protein